MLLEETHAFVAVAEAGSFSAASRKLGVPKSTLSRQVSRLEEHLGARLLQRTTRRLSLTETGEAYRARCCEALETLADAERLAQDVSGAARGLLKVSTSFDYLRDHLVPHLPKFHERYPEVELDVVASQGRVDLVSDGYDVAVRGGYLEDAGFVSRKLAVSHLGLFASPTYLDAHGRPETIDDLAAHRGVSLSRNGEHLPWVLQGPEGRVRLPIVPWIHVNEWGSVQELLVAGQGIGPLIDVRAVQAMARGELEKVLPEYGLFDGGLYAIYPSRHHLSPKVRVFVDFLAEHVRLGSP